MARLIALVSTLPLAASLRGLGPRLPSPTPLHFWETQLSSPTRYLPDDERLTTYKALQVAHRVHEGQCRRDGQPFISHPVEVAKLVASWGMDSKCVVAALLHDAVEDTPLTFSEVEECFGSEVRGLVQGVTRVSKMDPAKLDERTDLCLLADGAAADTLLQCLATVDAEDADADVADRLHNMRTLGAMAPVKRAKKARETERIFVPLAHYLGAHDVGRELQRLSTRYRSDGLKGHRALAARARSSILIEPLERLGDALRRIRGNGEWAGRAVFGSLPAVSLIGHSGGGSSSSRSGTSHAFKPPRIPQREVGSERRLRQLILQLDEAEPDRGLELYVSLRPLHERLTRHQAVMMREASWSPEER